MTQPITNSQASRIIRLMLLKMVLLIFLIGYVFFQAYDNRVEVVENQRAACERGKLDRMANADGWRIAEGARRDSGNISVANDYAEIAKGLETRGRINCVQAFPEARLFP